MWCTNLSGKTKAKSLHSRTLTTSPRFASRASNTAKQGLACEIRFSIPPDFACRTA